jgi:hypothetical protein
VVTSGCGGDCRGRRGKRAIDVMRSQGTEGGCPGGLAKKAKLLPSRGERDFGDSLLIEGIKSQIIAANRKPPGGESARAVKTVIVRHLNSSSNERQAHDIFCTWIKL